MDKKKIKTILVVTQLAVLSIFCLLAIGSASANQAYQRYENSDAGYYVKSAAQGLNERDSGRKYIGKADSEGDCKKKAEEANCTGQYVYYPHSKDCYCN